MTRDEPRTSFSFWAWEVWDLEKRFITRFKNDQNRRLKPWSKTTSQHNETLKGDPITWHVLVYTRCEALRRQTGPHCMCRWYLSLRRDGHLRVHEPSWRGLLGCPKIPKDPVTCWLEPGTYKDPNIHVVKIKEILSRTKFPSWILLYLTKIPFPGRPHSYLLYWQDSVHVVRYLTSPVATAVRTS